ncbi:MAG TPA: hypothetical protein VLT33_13140, partial [Labilithrix sp.]|nr:hypothetical protein [Labilithrix sp.]
MKTSFLETLWVVGVTLALLVTPTAARAAPSRNAATTTELGIAPGTDFQIAPLEAPSAAHPWGTVALAWNEADSAGMDRLRVGAWDLRAGRLVNVRTLRDQGAGDRALRLARDGESLLVLSSGFFAPGGATELIRLGLDLVEQGSVAFADGFLGSLVADGRFIAVG